MPAVKNKLSLQDALEQFLHDLRVEEGLNAYNVKNYYSYPLRTILLRPRAQADPTATPLPPLAEQLRIETIEDLNQSNADQVVLSLERYYKSNGEPISQATKVAYLKSFKRLWEWVQRKGLAPASDRKIGIPGLKKKRKDILTEAEVKTLLDAAKSDRDRLVMEVVAETGCREGAVADLRLTDLIEREKRYYFLRVRDKTGERMPPISRDFYRRLKAYSEGKTGRPRCRSEYLFISDRRDRGTKAYESLGKSGIFRVFKVSAARAGLDPARVKPHWVRAYAITRLCARTRDPVYVSEITGVSLAVISKHYFYPSPEAMWELHMKALGGEYMG